MPGLPYYNTGTVSTAGSNTPNLIFAGGADPVANMAIGYLIITPDGPSGTLQPHVITGIGTGTATVAPNITNELTTAAYLALQCSGMSVKAVSDLNTLLTSSNYSQIAGLTPGDGDFAEYFTSGGWTNKTPAQALALLFDNLPEVIVAGASTTDIGDASVTSPKIQISGSGATITSFGAQANGLWILRYAGVHTITHNATSLILYGAVNRTTAAGDRQILTSDASGNKRELLYWCAANDPSAVLTATNTKTVTNKTFPSISVVNNQNGNTSITGANSTPGASSQVRFAMTSDSAALYMGATSSTFTPNGIQQSNATFIAGNFGPMGIGNISAHDVVFYHSGANEFGRFVAASNAFVPHHIYPDAANTYDNGSAANYWRNGYIQNAWTVISDEDLKSFISPLTGQEIAVGIQIAPLIVTYKMNAAVAEKGDAAARKHCGWIAQRIEEIFVAQDLDPFAYGCVGSDLAVKTVTHTRSVMRQAKRTVTREIEAVMVGEDDTQVLTTKQVSEDEPVWLTDAAGNDILFELLDTSGNRVLDEDGKARTYKKPVMVSVEETYTTEEPDLDESGVQKRTHNIRPDEIIAFALAGLAASRADLSARVAALEAA
jgi:hypothetical protein